MGNTISYQSEISTYESANDLSPDFQLLLDNAISALESSYSPYSGFAVASAIKLVNGEIILGSNQENIAYPSGLCAERVAFFSAGTNFPNIEIESIAIVAKSLNGEITDPITPCGSCRQVMIEVESKQNTPITVIMQGENGSIWISKSVQNLIPFYFSSPKVGRVK